MSEPENNVTEVRNAEPTWRNGKSQFAVVLRVIIAIVVVLGALWLIYKLREVLLLIVLTVFFAYLVSPLVDLAERPLLANDKTKALSKPLAIGIVYIGLFLVIGIAFYSLVPLISSQITQLAQAGPGYVQTVRGWSQGVINFYHRYQLPEGIQTSLENAINSSVSAVFDYIQAEVFDVVQSLGYVLWLVLIPILAFFFLRDGEKFRRNAILLIPKGHLRWRADQFVTDISRTLAAYIRAQLIACAFVGTVCAIGFAIIGLPYVLILGIIAGLLEFIPLIGPFVVLIIASAFAGFHSLSQVGAVVLFLGLLRIAEDYVIYPKIVRHGIQLHPLAIILAVLCGAELAGIAGVFLAVPTVAVLSVTHRHFAEYKAIEDLVAESAAKRKATEEEEIQPTTLGMTD
ncbi:MAG TPA: AI-2E family transporter [Blastocatellia bacterium]|nr:AI-2E family transporter [Blastocatellia bacterium]